MALVLPPIGWIAPWVGLVAWWIALARLRRTRPWLRSAPIAIGLIVATLFADASVIVASTRMAAPGGRPFAAVVLWIAAFLSVTTFTVLRPPRGEGGEDDDGGSPVNEPEPPWWPDFERDFREYARRRRQRPRTPAGTR